MYAAMRGHRSVVEALLDAADADPKLSVSSVVAMKDKRGKTAADYARRRGHAQVVELLRETAGR